MKPIQIASYVTIASILLVTLFSGPVVPSVSLTQSDSTADFGEGTTEITVTEWPSNGTIEPVRFGGDVYQLTIDSAKLRVNAVSGTPILNYRLKIPAMNRTQVAVHTLSESDVGDTISLSVPESQLKSAPTVETLDGTVEIIVRNQSGKRVIGTRNITIRVSHP